MIARIADFTTSQTKINDYAKNRDSIIDSRRESSLMLYGARLEATLFSVNQTMDGVSLARR